jgi:hypothetical protein
MGADSKPSDAERIDALERQVGELTAALNQLIDGLRSGCEEFLASHEALMADEEELGVD